MKRLIATICLMVFLGSAGFGTGCATMMDARIARENADLKQANKILTNDLLKTYLENKGLRLSVEDLSSALEKERGRRTF